MIRCLLDPSIGEDSKCFYCCIYCNEENCEYRCELIKTHDTEEKIVENCVDAYE